MTDLTDALPLPVPSPAFLDRLATRRSAPAQSLIAPGPSEAELEDILHLGARTPDHGKLFPWRFVILGPRSRADLSEALAVLGAKAAASGQAVLVETSRADGPGMIRALVQAGVDIHEARWIGTDLESVFFTETGAVRAPETDHAG